jgi:hypothetical protein
VAWAVLDALLSTVSEYRAWPLGLCFLLCWPAGSKKDLIFISDIHGLPAGGRQYPCPCPPNVGSGMSTSHR